MVHNGGDAIDGRGMYLGYVEHPLPSLHQKGPLAPISIVFRSVLCPLDSSNRYQEILGPGIES